MTSPQGDTASITSALAGLCAAAVYGELAAKMPLPIDPPSGWVDGDGAPPNLDGDLGVRARDELASGAGDELTPRPANRACPLWPAHFL